MSLSEDVSHSDPCQVEIIDPVTKKKHICGVVKPTLVPHLKAHNKPGQKKKWNKKTYEEAFPEFSLGKKFVPSPQAQEKWAAARDERMKNIRAAKEIDAEAPYSTVNVDPETKKPKTASLSKEPSYEEKLNARFEILWDQVNRDVPAEQFARDAARAEFRIEEVQRKIEAAILRNDWDTVNKLQPSVTTQHDMLKKCMDFLDLTVKNRREKNQLGNDTVAQLVSNYAGTLRRMSPEKRETFNNRVKEVRRAMAERIRQKMLSEILDERIDEVAEVKQMTEKDYDDKIQEFIDRAGD